MAPVIAGKQFRPSFWSLRAWSSTIIESRCGLTKSVDDAYDEFDKKEPWDEVLS